MVGCNNDDPYSDTRKAKAIRTAPAEASIDFNQNQTSL